MTVRRSAAPSAAAGVARHLRGAVAALVVDKDHPELARIILAQQRRHRIADTFGFVAGRNDGHDRRPRPLPRRGPHRRAHGRAKRAPRPRRRYSQIASTIDAMSPFVTDSPCSGGHAIHRRRGFCASVPAGSFIEYRAG